MIIVTVTVTVILMIVLWILGVGTGRAGRLPPKHAPAMRCTSSEEQGWVVGRRLFSGSYVF